MPIHARRAEQQIEQALDSTGVNWQDVPEGIRQGMRADVERALGSGKFFDAGALSRLLDFQRVGATPTRGTLTLDPAQITREQNLARMGINSTDTGLHGLAKVQNENNAALITAMNRLGAGAADDAHAVGARTIGALQRGLDADKAAIGDLYGLARDSAGRSFPRVLRGVYVPVEVHPPARSISKTVLTDGTVKIEIGDEVLTLTPREDRALAMLQAGAVMQVLGIATSKAAA